MSLRRSARAPTVQPNSTAHQNANSSSSSTSSGRLDRNGRSNPKLPSPRSSIATKSRSSEELGDTGEPPLRRTRSSNDEAKDDVAKAVDDENEEENEEEEETRCVCGQLEYPGLPVIHKEASKDGSQIDSDPTPEDTTGWFIQCDECQVWQHGGCIGILDETQNPDKYFCEECHPDLHRISKDINGRKYSRYLPVRDTSSPRSSPEPRSKESSKRTRENRASRADIDSLAKGRRATMNSRDSAYDEAEQLRRAIEESKKDSVAKTSGARKGKRSRSESEEAGEDSKRRRTTSGSSSSHSKNRRQDAASEDEAERREKSKFVRGAAARNQRAKEARDQEATRDKERLEASKKRGQNHKRKNDDTELSPEPMSRSVSTKGVTSSKNAIPSIISKSHKKGGRPPTRRGRLGRNQYSKDRDPPDPNLNVHSPRSNYSQDGDNAHVNGAVNGSGLAESNGLGKPSRPRHMNPNRTTMNDMKRRVAAILEFISHTQVEMAGMDTSRSRSNTQNSTKTSTATPPDSNGNGKASVAFKNISTILAALGDAETVDEEAYRNLSAVEMMEVLTKRLMRWQREYGKHGEK